MKLTKPAKVRMARSSQLISVFARPTKMPKFTVLTEVRDAFHVSQHTTANPRLAVALHLAELPLQDGDDIAEEELAWLRRLISGLSTAVVVEVPQCRKTWMWVEGARHAPQYVTYVVQTELEEPRA